MVISATIGRAGSHPAMALFSEGATVGEALRRFNLAVGSEERIYDPNANIVTEATPLVRGTYTISKQQENGFN